MRKNPVRTYIYDMTKKPTKKRIEVINEYTRAINEMDMGKFHKLKTSEIDFLKEYMITDNATQAALRCGSTEASARNAGYEMLQKPHMREALREARTTLAKSMISSVEKSAADTIRFRDEARECRQYQAVAKLQEHLDAVTGVYNPKVTVDLNVKGSFNVMVPSFKPPAYALDSSDNEPIDVTPQKVKVGQNGEASE